MTSFAPTSGGWASHITKRDEADTPQAPPDLALAITFYDQPTVDDEGDAFLERLRQLKAEGRANRMTPAETGVSESPHLTRQRDAIRAFLVEATLTLRALPRFALTNAAVGLGALVTAQQVDEGSLKVAGTMMLLSTLKDVGECVSAQKAAMREQRVREVDPSYDPGDDS